MNSFHVLNAIVKYWCRYFSFFSSTRPCNSTQLLTNAVFLLNVIPVCGIAIGAGKNKTKTNKQTNKQTNKKKLLQCTSLGSSWLTKSRKISIVNTLTKNEPGLETIAVAKCVALIN